jgi:hypothetical protein
MPASKGTYRKADLANAIRAAIEAGLEVAQVRIIPTDHGTRYEIVTPRGADEFDDWLSRKGSDDATR